MTLPPLDLFFSYASEDAKLQVELEVHLSLLQRQGIVRTWHRGLIAAGSVWSETTAYHLEAAQIVVLLVSASYLASDHLYDVEMARALERHERGEACVIPVLLRECDTTAAPFAKLQALPAPEKPVTGAQWPTRDDAWKTVALGIRTASERLIAATVSFSPEQNPVPRYPDEETRALSRRLELVRIRRQALERVGSDTTALDQEIITLRRQIREGGQLRAGDSVGNGRYLLLRQVGRGGFATVWEAHDREKTKRVAMKILHPHLSGDPLRLERFFRGARVMAEFQHEAIVRVLERRGEDAGYYYFIMDFISGGDLRQAVLKKRIVGEAVLPVMVRITELVARAHSKGLVHRDVKPANILLDETGRSYLTDFDLVWAADTTGGTRTGAIGTVVYTAPEIADRPQDADKRADVYSLAMTTIFGLLGEELSLLAVRDLDSLVARLPTKAAVKAALSKAANWNRKERFKDAKIFCEALQYAVGTKDAVESIRRPSVNIAPTSVEESHLIETSSAPNNVIARNDHVAFKNPPVLILVPNGWIRVVRGEWCVIKESHSWEDSTAAIVLTAYEGDVSGHLEAALRLLRLRVSLWQRQRDLVLGLFVAEEFVVVGDFKNRAIGHYRIQVPHYRNLLFTYTASKVGSGLRTIQSILQGFARTSFRNFR
ncbi:MAG: protein kinase [Polyangiaceae bacterium]|nr:protein kinase [Polyangiaceae bacterium]